MTMNSNETLAQVRNASPPVANDKPVPGPNAIPRARDDKSAQAPVPAVNRSALRCDDIAEPGRRAQDSQAHYIALRDGTRIGDDGDGAGE